MSRPGLLGSPRAPLIIALVVLALVVAFGRKGKPKPVAPVPIAAPSRSTEPVEKPEPYTIPEDPPLGVVRVENSELPCDVDDVLARKCRRCHATPARHGAPFPMYTWTQLQVPRRDQPLYVQLGIVVKSGFMPYAIPANPPVLPLSDQEKQILLEWVGAGAPRGSCGAAAPKSTRRGRKP
jgi:hypothetical protein